MEYYGYMGKLLYVDLTNRDIREEELDHQLVRKFIGDFGIGAKLAYDLIRPGMDPLSPENPIIIGAGPLCGTSIPGASRCHVWSKWPATNTIGPGGGPMGFGDRLKYAGYDGVVIKGKSDKPIYLKISDEGIEFCDATEFWGRDVFEVSDKLWKKHGTMNSVMCIGPAGENLVKIAFALIDKHGTIGRFGLGALMGSKNLKAIVVGGKRGVKISDREKLMELNDEMINKVMNWPIREDYVNVGHLMYDFDGLVRLIAVTDYNTRMQDLDTMRERFGPDVYLKRAKKGRVGCPSCPIACRDISEVKEGDYKGLVTYQHSNAHSTGEGLDLKSMEEMLKFIDTLQRLGIDKVEGILSPQFLAYLCTQGLIAKADLEGMEIGNEKSLTTLANKIAYRQGIGDVLADGYQGMIKKFGKEFVEKYGIYIKGASVLIDPRPPKLGTMQLDLVVSPIGPNQGKGGMINPGKFVTDATVNSYRQADEKQLAIPKDAMDRITNTPFKVNMARLLRHIEDLYAALCCLGMCMRVHMTQFYSMNWLAELYSAVTGNEVDASQLKRAGERAWNIYKVLNVREGQSRKDDTFPHAWLEPLKSEHGEILLKDYFGTKALTAEDLDIMLDDYYDERGWEVERGIPTKKKLKELGLGYLIEDIEKRGFILT